MAELMRHPSGLLLSVDGHKDAPLPAWATRQSALRVLRRTYPDWGGEVYPPHGYKVWHQGTQTTIVVSAAVWDRTDLWVHASISHPTTMPTYDELKMMHDAVFGDRYSYQVFAPPVRHVNGHPYCLHLWGRDGDDAGLTLPDFGKYGVI